MNFDDFNFNSFTKEGQVEEEFVKEMRELVKKFGKKVCDYMMQIQESGGWKKFINTAWYGDEIETDIFTFKECIEWVKTHFKRDIHSGAIVGKKQEGERLLLKACFMGKDGKPLSDEVSHFLIIRCKDIDDNFKNQFGNNNTIVLR